ncbi:DciA family protein [Aurantimonas sp. MSK8Z-1]|uniref:DUF721 domain-containing protein n=1 Tax=Mangrovibrevibacter kandeliae TaxID=2968473 RepID=UPI0021190B52|nr:DciA family protein [Aurantimonas sp. MSK8Z-1]MCW4113531.1 DciA family protein [Aurantimonas sp. MSK8Z-1]
MSDRVTRGTRQVGELVSGVMDPILARKAGMTTGLLASWADIAGPSLADVSRPEKLLWPPRRSEDDPFEPATLVVACEGTAVLRLQHQAGEILARIDAYFGFHAVARLKLVQRAVRTAPPDRRPRLRPLAAEDHRRVEAMVADIADDKLREALKQFAESILARQRTST